VIARRRRRSRPFPILAAAAPAAPTAGPTPVLRLTAAIELTAAKAEGARPTFEIMAYTGAPMNVEGFYSPVVVELAGVRTPSEQIPILLDHDTAQIIGQGAARTDAEAVRVSGEVMGATPEAARVVSLAKDGFRWRASIGANVTRREFLEAGKKAIVNGREITGPMIIAREVTLQEVSFVAIGADSQTSAAVAASHSNGAAGGATARGGNPVDPIFKTWLEAQGYSNVETLSDQQLRPLLAAWKAETAPPPSPSPPRPGATIDKVLADAKADGEYRQKIGEITAQFLLETPGRDVETINKIEALAGVAVQAKWTPEKYENELLKASRPATPVFRPSALGVDRLTNRVLEAAACAAGRLEDYEKAFDDQTLQAAQDRFPTGIGLKQLILIHAEANGYRGNYSQDVTIEAQRAAFGMIAPNRLQASGFSNLSIATTLSNVANKFLMRGWNSVDMTPTRIARIRNVRDFKQITTVSLTGDLIFKQVGPTGEITHGTLGETVYTNQANTYARMLAITRTDIINDDLGALTDVPFKLGRGAGLKLNDVFWTIFLGAEAAGFFSVAHNNLNTAAGDVNATNLSTAETMFLNQTDPDGFPVGLEAKIILVPTALKANAYTMMTSERMIVSGSTGVLGDRNIWMDRFTVESSPYMSNPVYTGNSANAWYMLADPNTLPVVEIAALNGRIEPTVQSADAEFNVLGIQMRGYADIGVAMQEYRGGVKSRT
jgi:hypothetical protein